jgi:Trk K+ transport system NAD-binding subunit
MKIIILGAGQVGGTLAENLVGENNDITWSIPMAIVCAPAG